MNVVDWRMRKSKWTWNEIVLYLDLYLGVHVYSSLEGSVIQVSEQGSRKNLYQRIVTQFPEGWMNSGQISREGMCT